MVALSRRELFRVVVDGEVVIPCAVREFCQAYARTWTATNSYGDPPAVVEPIEEELVRALFLRGRRSEFVVV